MSTRTIIEINHDELNELLENISPFKNVLMYLRTADLGAATREGEQAGIRILGQRHHSEPEFEQRAGASLPSFDEARNYITNHTGYPPDARVMYDYLRTKVLIGAASGMKQIGWTCGEGDCGRIHDAPSTDDSYTQPVYVLADAQGKKS